MATISGSSSSSSKKCFRKKKRAADEEEEEEETEDDDADHHRKIALEEVRFLQKQRERRSGIPAFPNIDGNINKKNKPADDHANLAGGGGGGLTVVASSSSAPPPPADGDKDDLVLQDTFAQETAVTIEDPNMLRYVEQELAKRRGKIVDPEVDQVENELKRVEDQLYAIPDHLKLKKRNSEESSTQWTTGIAEVQLPIEFKLRNIEETEAAKKLLQERRLASKAKTELSIPSSYSADYFQRGRDYEEKLRREHPKLYKDGKQKKEDISSKSTNASNLDVNGRRLAATDELMLERFRKRERNRVMRR